MGYLLPVTVFCLREGIKECVETFSYSRKTQFFRYIRRSVKDDVLSGGGDVSTRANNDNTSSNNPEMRSTCSKNTGWVESSEWALSWQGERDADA